MDPLSMVAFIFESDGASIPGVVQGKAEKSSGNSLQDETVFEAPEDDQTESVDVVDHMKHHAICLAEEVNKWESEEVHDGEVLGLSFIQLNIFWSMIATKGEEEL